MIVTGACLNIWSSCSYLTKKRIPLAVIYVSPQTLKILSLAFPGWLTIPFKNLWKLLKCFVVPPEIRHFLPVFINVCMQKKFLEGLAHEKSLYMRLITSMLNRAWYWWLDKQLFRRILYWFVMSLIAWLNVLRCFNLSLYVSQWTRISTTFQYLVTMLISIDSASENYKIL